MTTLTVTARDEIPAVLLQVASAPAGAVTILRTDASGVGEVRLLPGQQPIGGSLVVYDYEAALTGTVAYEVIDSAAASTLGSTTTAAPFPHVHAAVLPLNGQNIAAVRDYDAGRETSGTIHWPILSSTPIPVTGPMRTRTGSFSAWCGSYEDMVALEKALLSGEVCQLRQPTFAGMDMYFTATRTRQQPQNEDTSPRRWELSVEYTEVDAPSGPLRSGAAWTFADHTALGLTFAQSLVAFPTFNARVVGP